MKICIAQTKPVKGDIQANIESHKRLIDLAIVAEADMIVFPELSLTGYEPELAKKLAIEMPDKRLDIFQTISDDKHISIGVGMPVKTEEGILIAMIFFQPAKLPKTYAKQYLHRDEEPYFVPGPRRKELIETKNKIAMAICYEISVPEHVIDAVANGANIYLASVAKSVGGVEKAINDLVAIANKYSMTVLMSNCVGHCDNFDCGGKTSIWNSKGILLGQLNDTNEGILTIDTQTMMVIKKTI